MMPTRGRGLELQSTQFTVVRLGKISGLYSMYCSALIKQETPLLLRLILNPLAEGLHNTPSSAPDLRAI
jgi:hypothetical protein